MRNLVLLENYMRNNSFKDGYYIAKKIHGKLLTGYKLNSKEKQFIDSLS